MKNKKLVLFGATGGLGKKLLPFLEKNYDVIPLGSNDCNIVSAGECKKLFSSNEVDIVVNLAGLSIDRFIHKLCDKDHWDMYNQLDVNIQGTLNVLSTALPGMRERGFGRIILASSVLVSKPVMGAGIYTASKAFIESITKTCSIENASKGITCNSIQLGYFNGGLTHTIDAEIKESIRQTIPSKEWGAIEDLYSFIDTIINNPYITGQTLKINGGIAF